MRLTTIVVLLLAALPLAAADPILSQDFQQGTSGWNAIGAGSEVHSANGSLVFTYTASPSGARSVLYLPLAQLPMPELQSIRFELSTDVPMPVALLLSEKKPGGANYSAVVWSAGPHEQSVVLSPDDFAVSDGPTDPVDPDHKLDLDQVEALAVIDLGQMFSAAASGAGQMHIQPHEGPHSIAIRNFRLLRDPLPASEPGVVDDFSRPTPTWFSPSGATFEQSKGTLTIRYHQLPDEFMAFVRQFPARDYKGATHLSVNISSLHAAQLVISIAERRINGKAAPRFNIDFLVFGGGRPDYREVDLSAFQVDENGPLSAKGSLDPANIQSISIIDVSGDSADNTLTLNDLRLFHH